MAASVPREVILRHALPVRVWHWVTVLAMTMLLLTGLYIFNMHPALYWGEDGHKGLPTLMSVRVEGLKSAHPKGTLQIGSQVFNTTGFLGHAVEDPEDEPGAGPDGWAFAPAVVFPSPGHLGDARAWHFMMAWVLVLTFVLYLAYGLVRGHFWRDFVPTRAQLGVRAVLHDLWHHVRLRRIRGPASRSYNLLQRLTYLVVVFVFVPLQVLTGLMMSNSFSAIFPGLYDLIGGRQSARTLHFLIATMIVIFVVIHLVQVLVAGVRNELGSMITGRFTIESEEPPT